MIIFPSWFAWKKNLKLHICSMPRTFYLLLPSFLCMNMCSSKLARLENWVPHWGQQDWTKNIIFSTIFIQTMYTSILYILNTQQTVLYISSFIILIGWTLTYRQTNSSRSNIWVSGDIWRLVDFCQNLS